MALLYGLPLSPSPAKTSTASALILRAPFLILPTTTPFSLSTLRALPISSNNFRAIPSLQNYIYPDPIPEFAQAETKKFRTEIWKKLCKDKEIFGDGLDEVVDVCSQILSDFLHKEYGGPGTLLVEPFTDMLIALKEKKLPGAPLAARESLLWAQKYVDQDWEVWNSKLSN